MAWRRLSEALAVAVLGAAAWLVLTFAGCREDIPQPIDAFLHGPELIDAGTDAHDAPPDGLVR